MRAYRCPSAALGNPESDQLIRGRMYSRVQLRLLMKLGEAAELAPGCPLACTDVLPRRCRLTACPRL